MVNVEALDKKKPHYNYCYNNSHNRFLGVVVWYGQLDLKVVIRHLYRVDYNPCLLLGLKRVLFHDKFFLDVCQLIAAWCKGVIIDELTYKFQHVHYLQKNLHI